MKKSILVLSIVLLATTFLLGACELPKLSSPTPVPVTDTATSEPIPPTDTPMPTDTPVPTETPTDAPTPTDTPTEAPTPTSTPQPVTVAQLNSLLRDHGYTRESFKGIGNYTDLRPRQTGYAYTGDKWLEPIIVYEDGYVRFEVLNDVGSRADRMELKLEMLDELFPEEFMAELRQAHEAYLDTVGQAVSGTANQVWPPPPQDDWRSLEGQYNVSKTTIGSYEVTFSLWFWQIECPVDYICWFPTFGDQVFLGQSSFVWYNMELQLAP